VPAAADAKGGNREPGSPSLITSSRDRRVGVAALEDLLGEPTGDFEDGTVTSLRT
jgi:hypothetical protein